GRRAATVRARDVARLDAPPCDAARTHDGAPHRSTGRREVLRSVLLDGLDLEAQLDVVADQEAAALERDVPGQAEVLAGDLAGGGEAGAEHAVGAVGRAVVLDGQLDRAGDAVDRQVAQQRELLALALDAGADEVPG